MAALPNGKLLAYYQETITQFEPHKVTMSGKDHLVEFGRDPRGDYEPNSDGVYIGANLRAFRWHLISYDRKYIFAGWDIVPSDNGISNIGVYDTKSSYFTNLYIPGQIGAIFSADQMEPHLLLNMEHFDLKGTNLSYESTSPGQIGLILWNYETRQVEFALPFDCQTNEWECFISNVIMDDKKGIIYIDSMIRQDNKSIEPHILHMINIKDGHISEGVRQDEPISDSEIAERAAAPFGLAVPRTFGTMSLSADSKYLIYHWASTVDILDATDPSQVIEQVKAPPGRRFSKVQFSPDGRFVEVAIDGSTSVVEFHP
jgi:hypothetical protein